MAALPRSEISFRRQGSSGQVWDDNKLVSGELNKTVSVTKRDDGQGKPGEAHKGYRTTHMPAPDVDPPSPRVSGCGLCGAFFGKPVVDSKNRNPHSAY